MTGAPPADLNFGLAIRESGVERIRVLQQSIEDHKRAIIAERMELEELVGLALAAGAKLVQAPRNGSAASPGGADGAQSRGVAQ